jgi:hypothetical protein
LGVHTSSDGANLLHGIFSLIMASRLLLTHTFFVAALISCSTAYQPDGFTGGFEELQLDENVYEITFSGNGYTSEKRVSDFVLLRAAEISLQEGYPYFRIIDRRNWSKVTTGKGKARTTCSNVFGQQQCNTSYSAPERTEKPRSTRTVELLQYKPPSGRAYSAKFVYKSITENYDLEQNAALLIEPDAPEEKSNPTIEGTYRLQYTDYANRDSVFRVFPQGLGGMQWVENNGVYLFSYRTGRPEHQNLYAFRINPEDGSLITARSSQEIPKWNAVAEKISDNPNAEFDLFELGSNEGESEYRCFNVGRGERPHATQPLSSSITTTADTLAACKALCPSVVAWRESQGYSSSLSECP